MSSEWIPSFASYVPSSVTSNTRWAAELKTHVQIYTDPAVEDSNPAPLTQIAGANDAHAFLWMWSSFCSATLHHLPTGDKGGGRRWRWRRREDLIIVCVFEVPGNQPAWAGTLRSWCHSAMTWHDLNIQRVGFSGICCPSKSFYDLGASRGLGLSPF